jgi:DNA polymerase-1
MGTWKTLVQNGGFSKQEAKKIEKEYHHLYRVADAWVRDRLLEASAQGYVELAFGLRLRTPILAQVLLNSESGLPWEAHGEMKTAGNALGQSWGMLNTRAANEFMQRVWDSEWKYDIKPVAQIHDAIYLVIRDKLQCLKWVNDNLIDCMTSYVPDEIKHPEVGLEAQLEIYYPSWSSNYSVPNNLGAQEIKEHLKAIGCTR